MPDDFSNLMKDFLSAIAPSQKDMPLMDMLQAFKDSQHAAYFSPGVFYAGPTHGMDFIIEGRIREWAQRMEKERREERERNAQKKPPAP
jgi:hypothetical protein